jgi:hypothetical protein
MTDPDRGAVRVSPAASDCGIATNASVPLGIRLRTARLKRAPVSASRLATCRRQAGNTKKE